MMQCWRFSAVLAVLMIGLLKTSAEAQRAAPARPEPGHISGQIGSVVFVNGLSNRYSLLSMMEVRQELGLSNEVVGVLEEIRRDAASKAAAYGEKRREVASIAERGELQRTFMQTQRDDMKANDERIAALLTEAQQRRLGELWLRAQGEEALAADAVRTELKIDAGQLERIGDAVRRLGRPVPRMKWADYEARLAKVLEQLTDEQRAAFDELRGEKFEFSSVPQRRRMTTVAWNARGGGRGAVIPPRAAPQDRAAQFQRYAEALIKRYDKNGDGRLQADEWESIRPSPAAADVNGDGDITVAEHAAWLQAGRPAAGEKKTEDAESLSKPATDSKAGGGDRLLTYARALVKKYDKSGDGVLQQEEWNVIPALRNFAESSGNGKLTAEELADWLRNRR
ncbi:MAG: hypothetical protein RIC55_35950 [Pirellulaceae bacterium]